jgi:hypothetical protein
VIVADRYEFILLGPLVALVTGGSSGSGVDLRSRATMRKE